MPQPIARHRVVAVSLSAAALVATVYLAPGWQRWASPTAVAVSGALAAAVLITATTAWLGSRHRRLLAATLLLIGAAFLALDACRVSVLGASPGPAPYTLGLAAVTALSAVGILLRRRGARWLALGLAAAGAVSAGLNLAQWMLAGVVDPFGWALAVWTVGALTALAALFGRDISAQDRLRDHERVWNHRDPLVRWMRAGTIGAIVAVPMLVVYAFVQDGAAPGPSTAAPALAGFLALAAILSARGQLVGAALLAIGGLGLVAMATAAVMLTPPGVAVRVAGYYLVFWLPAAASCLACGIALVRSAGRLAPRA